MTKKEFKNLKVGDKVQLKNQRGVEWNDEGLMDEFMGKVVTIKRLNLSSFCIEELGSYNRSWLFNYKDIAQKVDDYLKVECVDVCGICGTDKQFTEGKTYERINGKLVYDNGKIFEGRCMEDNPDEWDFCSFTKFKVLEHYKADDEKVDTVTETKPEVSEDIKRAYDDYMKVRCVKVCSNDSDIFTEGKTYERINGVMKADDGFPFESLCKSDDVSKWGFHSSKGETEFELVEHYKNGVDVMKKDKEVDKDTKMIFAASKLPDVSEYTSILLLSRINAAAEELAKANKKPSDEPTVCPVCGADLNKVKEVKRPAKKGEWIKIVSPFISLGYEKDDILQVERISGENSVKAKDINKVNILHTEYVVLEGYEPEKETSVNPVKEPFKPHMTDRFGYRGALGVKTKFKDAVGRELYTGDVVETFDPNGKSYGYDPVCENDGKQFIMGIKNACDDTTGEIKEGWKVIKVRSYKDVKDGEVIGGDGMSGVKYIKTEPKEEFKPHMVYKDEYMNNYGTIGVKTKFKDALGRELYTGDVVEIYKKGERIDTYKGGCTAIVETKHAGQFVMGIQICCNGDTGEIKDYKVLKVRGYEDVKDDEYVGPIHYIKTERK